ncbi:MAG: hypothetical protein LBH96_02205 [Candidatus Peribacteria bacterium]|jgi:hypothetical protein|nr:hypothetical protein [Candidatus Peribacteria bacterium]
MLSNLAYLYEKIEFLSGEIANLQKNIDNEDTDNARFNITKTSTASEVKVVSNVSGQVTLFEGRITNNQSAELTVNELVLSGVNTGTGWGSTENLYLTLSIGDKTSSKTYYNNTAVTFNSLGVKLNAGESIDVTVKATPTVSTTSETRFNAYANGTDANGNQSSTSSIYAVTFTVTSQGSATMSTNTSNVSTSAFAEKTDKNAFAQWNLNIKDETLTLKEVVLASTGWDDTVVNTWYITYSKGGTSKDINGTISIASSGDFIMTDLNEQLAPGNYTFTAYASLGGISTTPATNKVNVTSVAMKIDGAASLNLVPTPLSVTFSHMVFKAVPTLSFEKTRTDASDAKNLFGVKITYPETGAGSDSIEITGFTLAGTPAAIDVINANGVKIGNETGLTQHISLNPGQSVVVKFQATTTMTGGSSIDVKLTEMDYIVDSTDVIISTIYTNVAVWNGLQVNTNIPQ